MPTGRLPLRPHDVRGGAWSAADLPRPRPLRSPFAAMSSPKPALPLLATGLPARAPKSTRICQTPHDGLFRPRRRIYRAHLGVACPSPPWRSSSSSSRWPGRRRRACCTAAALLGFWRPILRNTHQGGASRHQVVSGRPRVAVRHMDTDRNTPHCGLPSAREAEYFQQGNLSVQRSSPFCSPA